MKLTLVEKKPEAADVTSFLFEAEQPTSWQAGQYLHYSLPHPNPDDRGIKRWFTISSAPTQQRFQLTTRFAAEKGSSFKRALKALPVGAKIEVDAPEGDFTVTDPTRNYLFIAGGIGITPFRSILAEAQSEGQQLHVKLLYASRTPEAVFRKELDGLARQNPQLSIEYIVEPQRIDAELLKARLAAIDNPYVYVSGPEPMVEAFEKTLKELGVAEKNLKADFFPGYTGV